MLQDGLFYLRGSGPAVLPWGDCNNWWNTPTCANAYTRKQLDCFVDSINTTVKANFCMVGNNAIAEKDLTDPVREFWE